MSEEADTSSEFEWDDLHECDENRVWVVGEEERKVDMSEDRAEYIPATRQSEEVEETPILGMGDSLIQVAREAEARVDAVKKIKLLALKVTNSQDWIDERGKPYLQVSGAEKVARLFGVNWQISPPVAENSPDGHFTFAYQGTFSFRGASITAIGTRSSKDAFFAIKGGKEVPPDKIDRMDVQKGAYTNCIGNGITRLLGIRNLTWSELNAAGIYPSGGKVPLKDKPGENGQSGQKSYGNPDTPASDKQRNLIFARLQNDLGMGSDEEMKEFSVKITGKDSSKLWTKGDIDKMIMEIGKRMGEASDTQGGAK